MTAGLSVNVRASKLVDLLVAEAGSLKIGVPRGSLGERLIDAGSRLQGGIAAGLRIAEICIGGLGRVAPTPAALTPKLPWPGATRSLPPVSACPGSPKAGWALSRKGDPGSLFRRGPRPAAAR